MPNATGTITGTVTIGTNAADGMNLTVIDKDTTTALTGASTSATIPTGTTIAAGTAAWGISGGALTNVTAMPASTGTALSIYTGNAAEEVDKVMTYHFSTAPDQAADVYSDVITYTVALND